MSVKSAGSYIFPYIAATVIALTPTVANAHVKWFCAFDVAGAPVGLENVLCPNFEQLVALAIGLLLVGCFIERSPFGEALHRSLDRVTSLMRIHTELMVRIVAAGFFAVLGTQMNVFLTPELASTQPLVPWVQLGIAAALLWRRTLPLAGLGIVVLFGSAVAQYGAFHLMDYPIFLGIAGYFVLIGLGCRTVAGLRPVDVLRGAAAVTLMWASVEKWAYPQWTFPVFVSHPGMSFGFDIGFYMRAAGVVEFTLAFALLWTPLVRRCAATILASTFITAIFEFGQIDAIGHSCIIAVLLAILADDKRQVVRRGAIVMVPVGYSTALAIFLAAYYGLHSTMFGPGSGVG